MNCVKDNALVFKSYAIAYDLVIEINFEGHSIDVYASPSNVEELVTGVLFSKGFIDDPREVKVSKVKRVDETYMIVDVERIKRCKCLKDVKDVKVKWDEVKNALMNMYKEVPKDSCPLAVHVGALYLYNNGFEMKRIMVDVSRRSLAYKLAGALLKLRTEREVVTPLATISARVSGDILDSLAGSGFKIVASIHHPLMTAVLISRNYDITLIGRDSRNELKVIVGSERVKGYEGEEVRIVGVPLLLEEEC